MNIYEKIQMVKQELLKANIKKSGQNKFAGYSYYELADFTPYIIQLCNKYKLFTAISFDKDKAELIIVNSENVEENMIYTSPMKDLQLKGCNEIQALGGTETYQRRYLYMTAFDIIENDMFDAVVQEEDNSNEKIDNNHVQALAMSIANNNISNADTLGVLAKYGYKAIEDIKVKDYAKICNELKSIKVG